MSRVSPALVSRSYSVDTCDANDAGTFEKKVDDDDDDDDDDGR